MEGSHFTPAVKIDWLLDEIMELRTLGLIKQEEIENLTYDCETLKERLAACLATPPFAESTAIKDLESELELVNAARRTMHAELEKLRGELADSRDVLVNREAQITQLKIRIETLFDEKTAEISKHQELQCVLLEAHKDLERARDNANLLSSTVNWQESERRKLQSSLDVANANLHRVTDELASSGNELAGAKHDLNEARKEQCRLEEVIKNLKQEIEDIEDSKDSDAERDVKIQELRTQLKSEALMHAETKKLLEAARNGRGL